MKRESINFSVALLGTLLAHAALLLAWPVDAPVVRIADSAAPSGLVANVAIVKVPAASAPLPTFPVIPAQAGIHVGVPDASAVTRLDARLRGDDNKKGGNDTVLRGSDKLKAVHDATPLQIPADTRLTYTLTKGSSSASAVLMWQTQRDAAQQSATYELSLEMSSGLFTLLKQTSTGDITPHGLAPMRYTDKRQRKSEQATHFDAALGTVTFSNNRPEAAWLIGAQDRLSVLVQLAALAQGKAAANTAAQGVALKPWAPGEMIQIPVASTDELELWQWEVQPLQVQPLAQSDAANSVRLLRRPRRAFDASIEVWLSPDVDYLPSRIRQTDSSGVTDQVLTKAERL